MDNDNEFEKLLEESLSETEALTPGQQIEAEIVSISGGCVFLHLDGKSEGQLDAEEMTDKDGNLTVKEGDSIKAYFLAAKNGVKHFTTKISGDKAEKAVLENAFESGIPVEGTVEKEIKGGFQITIGDTRAFCPYSQLGMRRIENPEDYIGKHLTFKILEYSENGRNILVSNRAILAAEQQEKIEELKGTLKEGAKISGTVKSVKNYGAFVDIGGIQALLPISEISRTRVEDISKAVSVGDEIEAVIIKLDWKNERISLSMKVLLPDPWDEAAEKYPAGSKHTGKVVRLTNFGAFVSLEPGLDGLVHISDIEGEKRINHPKDVLTTGQDLEVVINSLDIENKRISLKPVSKSGDTADFGQYMDGDTETYNPFGDLLKGK